jgi:hypothetical protein
VFFDLLRLAAAKIGRRFSNAAKSTNPIDILPPITA